MLAEPYRHNEGACELAAVLFGRRWPDIAVRDLFRHREMIFALSPAAYRAYLPAYLAATLTPVDALDEYGADLREYLIDSLTTPPGSSPDRDATTSARISVLDRDRRAATASVVRYLQKRWRVRDADEAIRRLRD